VATLLGFDSKLYGCNSYCVEAICNSLCEFVLKGIAREIYFLFVFP